MVSCNSKRRRALVVRRLDDLFFEPGNRKRSHAECYRRLVEPLFGICRNTFYADLDGRKDDPFDPELDPCIEAGLRTMVEKLLERYRFKG